MNPQALRTLALTIFAIACLSGQSHAQFTVLHSFTGPDGYYPYGGAPTIDGTVIYGMTRGDDSPTPPGTLFRVNTDGTGFSLLHTFTASGSDGRLPYGSLAQVGSTLYGLTPYGGNAGDGGTIFKIDTDGNNFGLLHSFTYPTPSAGYFPYGSLTISGSSMYGFTQKGGTGDAGAVFKMNLDGSGYTTLHNFNFSGDGYYPKRGSLVVNGSTIFGVTELGGPGGAGAIFKMNTDGTGYSILKSFSGAYPQGQLILGGSTLYGMTAYDGSGGVGTVFKMNMDGSGFTTLHNFTYPGDGNYPADSLTLVGTTLYGLTNSGPGSNAGTIFQLQTDGTAYGIVHTFTGGASNGASPYGSLSYSDGKLYGTTYQGGTSNKGTLFSVSVVPEPGMTALLFLGIAALSSRALHRRA